MSHILGLERVELLALRCPCCNDGTAYFEESRLPRNERIRIARQKAGLRQKELGDRADCYGCAIEGMERDPDYVERSTAESVLDLVTARKMPIQMLSYVKWPQCGRSKSIRQCQVLQARIVMHALPPHGASARIEFPGPVDPVMSRRLLARIIHERFYCNRGFATATSLAACFTAPKRAGSPLGRLTSCSRMPPFLAGSALKPVSPTLTRGPAPL